VRQLTFGGDNAEAYWSFAGDRLILQTNHQPYHCDQIEALMVATGQTKLVSTGKGCTTCSYFLPGDQEIIYASTHEASPACPAPPDMSKGYMENRNGLIASYGAGRYALGKLADNGHIE
jgi:hypothetical protein